MFFRLILALPCLLVSYALQPLLYLIAIGCWFVALFTGRVPAGLQRVGLFCLRFNSCARTRTSARESALSGLRRHAWNAAGGSGLLGGHGSLPADQGTLPPIP